MTPADLARSLTEAQRRALLWLSEEPQAWPKGSEAPLYGLADWMNGDPSKRPAVAAKMCRAVGRTEPTKASLWGKTLWQLTPLGLRVRAELAKER